MIIRVLTENSTLSPAWTAEHGLSLYIETGDRCILFDAGQSDAFAENALKMGVDLTKVDFAVLSHGHYDHSGGLMRFLEINDYAPVYVSCHAFGAHYHGEERYIGVDPALSQSGRIVPVEGMTELGAGIALHSCEGMPMPVPLDSAGLTRCEGGQFCPDDFRHEQYLSICEDGKRVLISGCSHRGILNIAGWFQPDVLVGGFHFMKLDPAQSADRERLENAAQALLAYPTQYYSGHCTGEAPYAFLKERMGERLMPLTTGLEIMI